MMLTRIAKASRPLAQRSLHTSARHVSRVHSLLSATPPTTSICSRSGTHAQARVASLHTTSSPVFVCRAFSSSSSSGPSTSPASSSTAATSSAPSNSVYRTQKQHVEAAADGIKGKLGQHPDPEVEELRVLIHDRARAKLNRQLSNRVSPVKKAIGVVLFGIGCTYMYYVIKAAYVGTHYIVNQQKLTEELQANSNNKNASSRSDTSSSNK